MEGPKKRQASPLILTITEITSHGAGIRIYGRLKDTDEDVCAKTTSFLPYLYVLGNGIQHGKLEAELSMVFNEVEGPIVHSIESIDKIPLMGYHPNGAVPMQKITLTNPRFISTCREMLENKDLVTYEGTVDYVLRYMVDMGIGGNDWIRIDRYSQSQTKETYCPIEVDFDHLIKLSDEDAVGGQRWLAFDIEACKGGSGRGFVDPKEDIVSQIGNTLFTSSYEVLDRCVFSMGGTVAKLKDDIECRVFSDEATMLLAWRDYVIEKDPDAFTGYNINGFDWWYLFERAKQLKIHKEFCLLGKDLTKPSTIRASTFSSAAKGSQVSYDVKIEGRFNFDMLGFCKDTIGDLRSYTLANVSEHVLNDTKVEMDYKDIPIFQAGTDEQRAHLAYYCWYDADLCMRLMEKRMAIVNYIESARVCGVRMKILFGGQQNMTLSLLLRYAQKRGFAIPSTTESQNDEKTQGATVKEPFKGFYQEGIYVLDFQSLYPSIIRDRNICYSTKVPRKWAEQNLKPADYFVPPIAGCNYCYVQSHISVGLLAEIEETLFNKRVEAKADLKRETDPDKKNVLNGRQLAIKVRMNSIYGFTKANKVCDKDLMETICAVGREMIDQTTGLIEATYEGSKVVYGDTDSVFVKYGNNVTIEEGFKLGHESSTLCTNLFTEGRKPVHKLVMEKAFQPFVLIGKKKYAGLKYMTVDSTPFMSSSGLENVRRDNALIASESVDKCLTLMLKEGDYDGTRCIGYVHQIIRDLLMGRIEISKLIISKRLSNATAIQAHSELAKKMKARGDEEYHTGDRVKYVIISGVKGSKGSECAEDPAYALRNRLNIDYNYYIYNQLMKPLLRIMTPILAPTESLNKINKGGKTVYLNDKEIENLTAYKALFVGDHMMHKVQRFKEGAKTGMMKFAKKLPTCVGCGCRSKEGVCKSCEPKSVEIYMDLTRQQTTLQHQAWQAWTKCQRCVGDKHVHKIACNNRDCDNFYQREKVIYDIEDLAEKLDKL